MTARMTARSGPDQSDLACDIRQMIAVLEDERQALAALDLDGLVVSNSAKLSLCDQLEMTGPPILSSQTPSPQTLSPETRALLETARRLNEVNRRVRNLLAANVAARLDALSGSAGTYRLPRAANA